MDNEAEEIDATKIATVGSGFSMEYKKPTGGKVCLKLTVRRWRFSIAVTASWNKIPVHIRKIICACSSVPTFKTYLNTFLFKYYKIF